MECHSYLPELTAQLNFTFHIEPEYQGSTIMEVKFKSGDYFLMWREAVMQPATVKCKSACL